MKTLTTECCIAGGGPAGMMLGYMLARAGIDVLVFEKWADFFRDFRGDTIHPSTMEILAELGLLDEFLALKHEEVRQMTGVLGNKRVVLADFSTLKVRCPFIAFVPQWDFLNLMRDKASQLPNFKLLMSTQVTDIKEEFGRVVGVRAQSNGEVIDINCELVVGADGRNSTVRKAAGLKVLEFGAPIDVLWFRISRKPDDPREPAGRFASGRMMVMLYRDDYWQCGFIIKKDSFEEMKELGVNWFRSEILELAPFLGDRVNEVSDLSHYNLLSVRVDRLEKWYKAGLICIGDAAHVMSPVGGVGINLAVQDAVAAANILIGAWKKRISEDDLAKIQKRRQWPTVATQRLQLFLHNRLINKVVSEGNSNRMALLFSMFNRFSLLRRIPSVLIGQGFRPEHVAAAPDSV